MKNTSKTPTIQFESTEAVRMYEEFQAIPDNPFSFELPENFVVTSEMMRTMLQTAYRVKGWEYIEC